MTRSKKMRFAVPLIVAFAILPATLPAQEQSQKDRITTMATEYAISSFYNNLDYKVAELLQMQALAILEGYAEREQDDGAYRSDAYKLNEWMPHYKGQMARLIAAANRQEMMADSDRDRFIAESARFSDLILAGDAIVEALTSGDLNAAYDIFRTQSVTIAKEIRGGMYTLASDSGKRFVAATRGH